MTLLLCYWPTIFQQIHELYEAHSGPEVSYPEQFLVPVQKPVKYIQHIKYIICFISSHNTN